MCIEMEDADSYFMYEIQNVEEKDIFAKCI